MLSPTEIVLVAINITLNKAESSSDYRYTKICLEWSDMIYYYWYECNLNKNGHFEILDSDNYKRVNAFLEVWYYDQSGIQ